MPIEANEHIVRAICSDKWDGQRLAPSLFTGSGTSVSRLAIIPLENQWDLFREYVQEPPERMLEMLGEIGVENLQAIGRSYAPANALTVEPKPEDWNAAHAEIPQKISRGLANKILPALKRHFPAKEA